MCYIFVVVPFVFRFLLFCTFIRIDVFFLLCNLCSIGARRESERGREKESRKKQINLDSIDFDEGKVPMIQ